MSGILNSIPSPVNIRDELEQMVLNELLPIQDRGLVPISGIVPRGNERFQVGDPILLMNMHGRILSLLLLYLLAGCSSPPPSEIGEPASSEASDANDSGDSLSEQAKAAAQPDVNSEYDSLVKLIVDTVGEPVEEEKPPPFSPSLTAEQAVDIVGQCVCHVLTHPDLAHSREFYGTKGDCDVVLVNDGAIDWPDGYEPRVEGYNLRFASHGNANRDDEDRKLGICLGKLDLLAPSHGFVDGNVVLILANVGGIRNGAVIGGCSVYYVVEKKGDEFAVRCVWAVDP